MNNTVLKQLNSNRKTLDANVLSVLQYLHLTPAETCILNVAHEIGFGELQNVEIAADGASIRKEISQTQLGFIHLIRNEGIAFISRITVHNGEPTVIEIDGTSQGIKYTRKLKIQAV